MQQFLSEVLSLSSSCICGFVISEMRRTWDPNLYHCFHIDGDVTTFNGKIVELQKKGIYGRYAW